MPWRRTQGVASLESEFAQENGLTRGAKLWTETSNIERDVRAERFDVFSVDLGRGIEELQHRGNPDGIVNNRAAADLPMGGYRHTNVGRPEAVNEYATVGQLANNEPHYIPASGVLGSGDSILLNSSIRIPALEDGLKVSFLCRAANTTNDVVLSLDGLANTGVRKLGNNRLDVGDFRVGRFIVLVYDGTYWNWIGAPFVASTVHWDNVSGKPTIFDFMRDVSTQATPQKQDVLLVGDVSDSNRMKQETITDLETYIGNTYVTGVSEGSDIDISSITGGRSIAHEDTSSIANINLTGNNVLASLNFDDKGHFLSHTEKVLRLAPDAPTITLGTPTDSTIPVSISAVADASSYDVEWRRGSTGSWSSATSSGTSYTITGLSARTSYQVRARTNKTNAASSGYSPISTATTDYTVVLLGSPRWISSGASTVLYDAGDIGTRRLDQVCITTDNGFGRTLDSNFRLNTTGFSVGGSRIHSRYTYVYRKVGTRLQIRANSGSFDTVNLIRISNC